MADAVSSPLLRHVSYLLNSLRSDAYFDDQILSGICDTLSRIEALVRNKEDRFDLNTPMDSWLVQVKDVAYEIYDFVDEYEVSVKLKQLALCSFSFSRFRFKMGKKLKSILERLNHIFVIGLRFPIVRVESDEEEESEGEEDVHYHYTALPSHLKQCFAYCSIFPEGYVINKEKLIQMWIAEGLVTTTTSNDGESSRTLEEIGDDYFKELLLRSFFGEISRDDIGDAIACTVHDSEYELARLVSSNECLIVKDRVSSNLQGMVRRASLVSASGLLKLDQSVLKARKFRTLVLQHGTKEEDNIAVVFEKFSCLRMLDLSQSGIHKLPVSIGNLKFLKYLDLSRTYIECLPRSIGNLKMLQSLGLSSCYNLRELSDAICKLINLRNLDIESCCSLTCIPSGIGQLRHLQKMPVFVLGKRDGCATLGELNGLDVKGGLEIKNLEYVRSGTDAKYANLHEKRLQSLGLSWGQSTGMEDGMSTEVIESLRPPPELKVLRIVGYSGSRFPSWLRNEGLLSLVKISLINCSCEQLPPLGQLLYLKDLYIKGMPNVRIIHREFYGSSVIGGFPSLKQLELYDMPNLFEWRLEEMNSLSIIGESSNYMSKKAFPCLETLIINRCNMLTDLPLILHLKNLALWNSNPVLLRSLHHMKSLSSLVINDFQEPKLLPKDIRSLKFIRKLTIYDSGNLVSLLKEEIRALNSLEHLSIMYCNQLMSLPEGPGYLTSLQKLDIVECEKLEKIPIPYSLQEFVIEDCPLLKLSPDSMRNLTNLQKLVVKRCPELKSTLENIKRGMKLGIDEDWSKIFSIPILEID